MSTRLLLFNVISFVSLGLYAAEGGTELMPLRDGFCCIVKERIDDQERCFLKVRSRDNTIILPPAFVAITGFPNAMYSIIAFEIPSA